MDVIFNNTPNKLYRVKGKELWDSRSTSVEAIVFAELETGLHVLTIKRSKNMPDEPGKWAIPSGYLDWDETLWENMVRELYEETTFYVPKYEKFLVSDNEKFPFKIISDPCRYKRQNIVHCYFLYYDFSKYEYARELVKDMERYKNKEVSEVKWSNFFKDSLFNLAFRQDIQLKEAYSKFIKK